MAHCIIYGLAIAGIILLGIYGRVSKIRDNPTTRKPPKEEKSHAKKQK